MTFDCFPFRKNVFFSSRNRLFRPLLKGVLTAGFKVQRTCGRPTRVCKGLNTLFTAQRNFSERTSAPAGKQAFNGLGEHIWNVLPFPKNVTFLPVDFLQINLQQNRPNLIYVKSTRDRSRLTKKISLSKTFLSKRTFSFLPETVIFGHY